MRVQGSGFGFRDQGSGFQGLGFRVHGEVHGLGVRAPSAQLFSCPGAGGERSEQDHQVRSFLSWLMGSAELDLSHPGQTAPL